MAGRIAIVVAITTVLKLLIWTFLVGDARTPAMIAPFTALDAVATLIGTPWAAMGSPTPTRGSAPRRAIAVALGLMLAQGLVNVALQVPFVSRSSADTFELVFRLVLQALPQAFLAGPVGAVAVLALAIVSSWGWLMIRLPSAPVVAPVAESAASAKGPAGARTAQSAPKARPGAPPARRPPPAGGSPTR